MISDYKTLVQYKFSFKYMRLKIPSSVFWPSAWYGSVSQAQGRRAQGRDSTDFTCTPKFTSPVWALWIISHEPSQFHLAKMKYTFLHLYPKDLWGQIRQGLNFSFFLSPSVACPPRPNFLVENGIYSTKLRVTNLGSTSSEFSHL